MLKASLDETLNNKKEELLRKEREINENTINSKAIKIEEKNSNLKIEELNQKLTMMELEGLIKNLPGNNYARL